MQGDGNLVAYDTDGKPKWSSNSRQKNDPKKKKNLDTFKLSVQNDRNVVIISSKGTTIWSTNTGITPDEEDGNMIKIGYVNDTGVIKFGSAAVSVGKCEFTFTDVNHDYAYDLSCDINALNTSCNGDNLCSGFIYYDKDNTWQKIPSNATPDLYKITDTSPKIFIKELDIDMQDKSCLPGKSKFVDSNEYSYYPKGNDFIMNGDQCNIQSGGIIFPIDQEKQKYDKMNKNYEKQKLHISKKYPTNSVHVQQNNELYTQMQTKTNEYTKVLNKINTEKNKNMVTYQQMNQDMHGIENNNKSNALLWGLSSIVLIGIVVTVRNSLKE